MSPYQSLKTALSTKRLAPQVMPLLPLLFFVSMGIGAGITYGGKVLMTDPHLRRRRQERRYEPSFSYYNV